MGLKIKTFKLLKLAEELHCFECERKGDKILLKFWPSFLDDILDSFVVFVLSFKVDGDEAVLEDFMILNNLGARRIKLDSCYEALEAWLESIDLKYG